MIEERPFDDAARMSTTLASEIAGLLRDAVAARGTASFVATGGTTPAPLYRALAQRDASWADVTVTLSDERWIAADDPASNEALVRATLLSGAAGAATFVPLKTEVAHPADAVSDVDHAVRAIPRPFDVCLLGVGADGHIASLFPGAVGYDAVMAATENDPLVCAIHAPDAAGAADRMTLTLSALLASRLVIVMFTGAEKLAVYRSAKSGAGATPLRALLMQDRTPVWACWSLEGAP